MVIRAENRRVNDSLYGGCDYVSYTMTDEHDNELSIQYIDDLWYVCTWINDKLDIDRFPHMDRKLWGHIYSYWRQRCRRKLPIAGLDWSFIDEFFRML